MRRLTSVALALTLGIAGTGRWLSGIYGFDPPYSVYYLGFFLELAGMLGSGLFGLALVALAWTRR